MATLLVAAWQAGKAGQASAAPTLRGGPRVAQSITTSASNQVSTVKAAVGEVLMLSVTGGVVALAFAEGADPNASTGPHYLLNDGGAIPVDAVNGDLRVAVVDA